MPAPQDLVFQTSTTTGTNDLDLNVGTYRSFASAFGTGNTNTFDYYIVNVSIVSPAAAEWEIGVGYIDATSSKLIRNTVVKSSNSNNKVSFSAGTKNCTNDIQAKDQVRTSTNSVTDTHAVIFDGTSGSLVKSAGLSLGSIASQAANNVSITGGSISGLSPALGVTSGGTGLSTLTAGDTLYASATNTLAKLAKGTDGQFLKLVSGFPAWAAVTASVSSVRLTTYTSTPLTPYSPPAGLIGAIVICTGGGGGGGSASRSSGSGNLTAGGGGGAGATGISFLNAATIGASVSITIGAAGAAGTSGGSGGNGSASSFGSLIIVGGGNGGGGAAIATGGTSFGNGGSGGSGSAGQLLLTGASGGNAGGIYSGLSTSIGVSGNGGSTFWGGGAAARIYGGAVGSGGGISSVSYGAGGSGGVAIGNTTTTQTGNGGAGLAGVCAIFEFIAA